jgi:hypothetical protein
MASSIATRSLPQSVSASASEKPKVRVSRSPTRRLSAVEAQKDQPVLRSSATGRIVALDRIVAEFDTAVIEGAREGRAAPKRVAHHLGEGASGWRTDRGRTNQTSM